MIELKVILASLALVPVLAQPLYARSSGGALSGAIGSALRHAGDDSPEGVTAAEGMVSAADPEGMAQILQDLGYRAEVDVDGVGDPMIRSSTAGASFVMYFFGCVDNSGCDSILYSAGFDLPDGMSQSHMNAWNQDAVVATGYLDDEDDPYLQSYVLTRSGIPHEVFETSLKEWSDALGSFQDYIHN